jgi:hypothetical protein
LAWRHYFTGDSIVDDFDHRDPVVGDRRVVQWSGDPRPEALVFWKVHILLRALTTGIPFGPF